MAHPPIWLSTSSCCADLLLKFCDD